MPFSAAIFDELESLYPDTRAVGASALEAACHGMIAGAHIMLLGFAPGLPVAVTARGPHTAIRLFEMRKLIYNPSWAISVYALNTLMVGMNLALYFRNRAPDKAAGQSA